MLLTRNDEPYGLFGTVAIDIDIAVEVATLLTSTIGNLHFAALPGHNGLMRIVNHSATARSLGLLDDQRGIASIGESKGMGTLLLNAI